MKRLYTLLIPVVSILVIQSSYAHFALMKFFRPSRLKGWEVGLSKEDTLPYIFEKMNSVFLFGARSSSNSYIFVTMIDNTIKQPAFSVDDLNFSASINSFSFFDINSFKKEIHRVKITNSYTGNYDLLPVFATTMNVENYKLSPPIPPIYLATVKTMYFPIVLQKGNQYYSYLLMADFRGESTSVNDIKTFDIFCNNFTIPEHYKFMDIHAFNAIQPQLDANLPTRDPTYRKGIVQETGRIEPGVHIKPKALLDIY